MRFDLTDEQEAIRETIARLLADRLVPERVEELVGSGRPDTELWEELCELGFAGIAVAEEHGGQGLGLLELGLACEEAGAALAPIPLLSNAAAGVALEAVGSDGDRADHLPAIAAGSAPGSVALLSDGCDPLAIDPESDGPLVVVDDDGGVAVGVEGLELRPVPTIDLMRRYREVRGSIAGRAADCDPRAALDRIEVLLAAELTGVAQRALDLAIDYAREREQFNRPIGSFQGVSHRCAEIMLEVESARSIWRYAGWVERDRPDELALAASTAKVAAVTAATTATTGAIQVLGGIGFTWEHDAHRYLRRVKVAANLLGSASFHRRRITDVLRHGAGAAA